MQSFAVVVRIAGTSHLSSSRTGLVGVRNVSGWIAAGVSLKFLQECAVVHGGSAGHGSIVGCKDVGSDVGGCEEFGEGPRLQILFVRGVCVRIHRSARA